MKKIFSFLLMAAMLLAVGASVASCSSGDNEEEEYVPVESPFAKLLREKPVHQLSYSHNNSGTGSFGLESDPMVGNYKTDYYTISFTVYNAPADDMYDGRYEIEQVGGSVWGWKEQWRPEYKKTMGSLPLRGMTN